MSKTPAPTLDTLLECMLAIDLDDHVLRMSSYSELFNICQKMSTSLNLKTAESIVALCTKDLGPDSKFFNSAVTILNVVLGKIKEEKCPAGPYLLPSAVTILNAIKAVKECKRFTQLVMALNTLNLYPDDIIIALATSYTKDLITIFDFTGLTTLEMKNMEKAIIILIRILEILPSETKKLFVKDGIDVWLNSIVPAVNWPLTPQSKTLIEVVQAIELMLDSLATIDYTANPHWESILVDICEQKRYPKLFKHLVEEKSDLWHRLWIIFIKLLKDDITKVRPKSAVSPINALLPVVELAFRLDPLSRCRAFECWSVLIDNFSSELNGSENHILNKRLKLLITPMKLNNAKVLETVLAKLNTWWHLIRKFHSKMDRLTDTVLLPFLAFCFGKPSAEMTVPGLITRDVGVRCAEMLVEIVGHVNCEGCVSVPRLAGRLINTKLLVVHWEIWLHSLMIAIHNLASGQNSEQLLCLWSGFIMIIAELPENQIRADLFTSLLTTTLNTLILKNDSSIEVMKVAISIFSNEKTRQLLKTKNKDGAIYALLKLVLYAHMNGSKVLTSVSRDPVQMVAKLRPLTDFIVDSSMCNSDQVVDWLFSESVADQSRTFLWSALADSVIETKNALSRQNLFYMVQWPIKNMNIFLPTDYSVSYKWYTLYSFAHPTLNDYKIDKTLFNMIMDKINSGPVKVDLALSAALALLRQQLISDTRSGYEKEVNLLMTVTKLVENCDDNHKKGVANHMATLLDTLIVVVNNIIYTDSKNTELVKHCVDITKTVLMLQRACGNKALYIELKPFFDTLLRKLYELFNIEEYAHLKPILDSVVKSPAPILINTESTPADDQITVKTAFSLPELKVVKKVKVSPKIVSTTVENGEEYVVVKSNWKFNPRKLTENQKEKLKKKREDIPALYQDLSQSQDEFKLTSWKTESQDGSSTNTASKSNSKSNDDVNKILKNITSSDVVPNIMENIISSTVTTATAETVSDQHVTAYNNNMTENEAEKTVTNNKPQTPKTPRMALKDRVFRNVRNLIEKSGLQTEDKVFNLATGNLNQTVNEKELKTPVTKPKNTMTATYSAPSKLINERPARSIKKPKKFEDSEEFTIKRKKRSHGNSQTDSDSSKSDEVKDEPEPYSKTENRKEIDEIRSESILPPDESKIEETVPEIITTVTNNQDAHSGNVPVIEVMNLQPSQSGGIKEQLVIVSTAEKIDVVIEDNMTNEIPKENTENPSQIIEEIATPVKSAKKKATDDQSSIKKKRSRIEKQLLIDMVEGHPLLQLKPEKRITRKNQPNDNDTVSKRRKSLILKSYKIKAELQSAGITDKKRKEKEKSTMNLDQIQCTTITDSQENFNESDDIPMSEDIIESSQDSTLTAISVKSATKKKLQVLLSIETSPTKVKSTDTQELFDDYNNDIIPVSDTSSSQDSREDIELSKNKTAEEENPEKDLTENMDTEPIESSSDVIIINENQTPIVINTDETSVGEDTEEVAEADTLPMEVESEPIDSTKDNEVIVTTDVTLEELSETDNDITHVSTLETTPNNRTCEEITDVITESSNTGSPLKDDARRKKDFLNDTIEISPIKTMSPIRDDQSSLPESSSEFVVIKLTSPVQSNGEPVNEKCDSPEIFTEEKISPDKRDQSPPRKPTIPSNCSPSSSLSLKKNRPQMWSNGRAAQMLGLCVPDKLQSILNTDRSNHEEPKKSSPVNTPARRNLRILYNSVSNTDTENQPLNLPENKSEDSENFLKFKRSLPTADSSPAGPILKRKLADITDETTASPASKRKRVSFHDPPVSTTVAVQKYIEPCGIRSPSSSAIKRQERQMRGFIAKKSPKRLDSVFRLDTVLTKALESFSDSSEPTVSNETEMSLDETPAVEVIKTSELNDTDPICIELVTCEDPIENIASELSSPTTKDLFLKELSGKIATVGDLAKMTELDVNRLCIKAPKVKVAKKVLNNYASKKIVLQENTVTDDEPVKITEVERVNMEVQTNEVPKINIEVQTVNLDVSTAIVPTQTDTVSTSHCSVQTNESGSKSTKDIISSCLVERPDFIDQIVDLVKEAKQPISNKLPLDTCRDLLLNKITFSNSTETLNQVTARIAETTGSSNLNILQDFLVSSFDARQLILFCSQLLQKVHEKM